MFKYLWLTIGFFSVGGYLYDLGGGVDNVYRLLYGVTALILSAYVYMAEEGGYGKG